MQNFPGCHKGQGATEYLVLLAVVLIVALVSVALLGFFPQMALDAQIAQSQAYWRSATPIAITEAKAFTVTHYGWTGAYLRFKNTGNYPIRITRIFGAAGAGSTTFGGNGFCGEAAWNGYNYSDYFYLAPGEESYIAHAAAQGLPCHRENYFSTGTGGIGGASSECQNSSTDPGMVVFNSFGFEYIMYIDGQQITKREIGKKLIIKCDPRYP